MLTRDPVHARMTMIVVADFHRYSEVYEVVLRISPLSGWQEPDPRFCDAVQVTDATQK